MKSLPARLREVSGYALMDAARVTVLEAADEIERLRAVAEPMQKEKRAEVSFALTDAEREAIHWVVGDVADITGPVEDTLRGLLERLGGEA